MDDQESFYKREEDREWRKQVDNSRALLTTAINVLQEQVRDLRRWKSEMDGTLRGHGGQPGLIAEYERLDETCRRLYAVIWQDPTGQKGLLHDVDVLMGRKRHGEELSARRWTLMEKLLIALVSAMTAITVALLAIEPVRKQIGIWFETHLTTSTTSSKTALKRSGNKK